MTSGKKAGQREYYDGPGWNRGSLFAECVRRGINPGHNETMIGMRAMLRANDDRRLAKDAKRDWFVRIIKEFAKEVHQVALDHGWAKKRNDGETIALMHSELSEALEYCRKDPATPSDHIPEFTGLEEEMADVIIRVLDFCEARELRIVKALLAKHEFNKNRPYKHGGKKF